MNAAELQVRLKKLACRLIPICEALPQKKVSKIIEDQLLRSGFSAKLSIAFEEIDEALFWLEATRELALLPPDKLGNIIKESDEVTRILAASRKTAQNKIFNKQF